MEQRPIMSPTRYRREVGQSVLRVVPGQTLALLIASRALVGCWTHFLDEARTYPCVGAVGGCRWDHTQTSLRWQGWLQVSALSRPQTKHLAITWAAARDCPYLFDPPQDTLRGHYLNVSRGAGSIRSRLHLIFGPKQEAPKMPLEEDLRAWFWDLLGPQTTWPKPTSRAWDGRPLTMEDVKWDDNPFVSEMSS